MTITLFTHRFVRLTIAAVTVAGIAPASVSAQQGAGYEVVSTFDLPFRDGRAPSSLRQDTDGTFYGTTSAGGRFDTGILFQMDATGVVTPLHSFDSFTGSGPFGLVRASNGRFYGLTRGSSGGASMVFTFTPGSAPTTVHEFFPVTSQAQGFTPVDLFAASDGNVYGLTAAGGDFGNGIIFAIEPSGSYRTLFSIPANAGGSMTSLVRGMDDRFYVTAQRAGVAPGTVFMIDEAGTVTNIHTFTGAGGDGNDPIGLMQRSDGRFYGTTRTGGEHFVGTVYAIDLDGTYRIVHSFIDGSRPGPDLLEASDGNLYGVTQGLASLFTIDSSETLTTLHDLNGLSPGELIQGLDGRLYGPTAAGGLDGGGTIIVRDTAGMLTTLHEFSVGESAGRPNGVIQGRDGVFYGTTILPGGTPRQTGTVFAMDTAGARTTLHTFVADSGVNEGVPKGHLFEGVDGSLYGTTYTTILPQAPPAIQGQIFTISPGGLFTRLASAGGLQGGVIEARDGRLYGVTEEVPPYFHIPNVPKVFRVEANGTLTTLHGFGQGSYPVGELVEIDDGSLYGTTEGGALYSPTDEVIGRRAATIFQVDPATGAFATRHTFPEGTKPAGRLVQGTDGLLYGTTVDGGAFGVGTVFSLDAAGTLTTLHHFSGADGENPNAGVIQGLDGRLYGTTTRGGAFGHGTVFVMNITGGLTTLHHFALIEGASPVDGLIQANDGALYGAASSGGPTDGGVIFRVRLNTSPVDQYYELVSRNSGKCLDVFGASTDAVAPVIQWICHGGPNQQWRLEPAGGGAFHLIARHSGQALDVYGAFLDDVTPIIQYPLHGGDNQMWTLEPAPDGYVSVVAVHSGKALDVEYASTDDGARVIQYAPHGGTNQQWLLRRVE